MPTRRPVGPGAGVLAALLVSLVGVVPAAAQSLTAGSLRGQVRAPGGTPVRNASMALESASGGLLANLETGFDGEFRVALLLPGEYRLLIEQLGFQPVRLTGIVIAAGETTVLTIDLERRPPPITELKEITASGARVGTASGRPIGVRQLDRLDWRREASDGLRDATDVLWPADGRFGFGLSASGVAASRSRVIVDGVVESMLRHPGLPGEPAPTAPHARDGVSQIRVLGTPFDAEWRGTVGSILTLQTRSGGDRLRFSPYLNASSATIGGRSLDNPLDSTAASVQGGAVLSGPIVPDTAHFLLRFDYRSLQTPTAYPWESDTARFDGAPVSLRETLAAIARDSFATALGPHVSPAVRSWRGASGLGKLDWMLSTANRLALRFSFADWRERTPYLGEAVSAAAGSALKARDFAGAVGITTVGASVSNELRAGFSTARRDYDGSPLPETNLGAEGVGFGGSAVLPGFFDARTIDISDALQIATGLHHVKLGVSYTSTNYQQDYRYGSAGVFQFADLDRFGAAQGSFYQAVGSERAQFSSTEWGAFLQDTWTAAPDVQLLAAMRYEINPVRRSEVGPNTAWFRLTGIRNDSLRTYYSAFAPRLAFVWDVLNRGEWVLRGGLGVHYGRLEPATFAEAVLYDGGVTVRRGAGTFASWPALPDETLAPTVGPALTILYGAYRPPRALKAEFAVTRSLRDGTTFHLAGSYHHTDYLIRRADLNRVIDPVGTTQEGRPVFGRLEQHGGFVSAQLGSNRRFSDFDLVSGLTPTGFADHYELTAILERRADPVTLSAAYTYAKTTDNLIGARALDPADQLSPFPAGLAGADWDRGPSDFDVPHRLVLSAEYRSRGRTPVTVAGRYRLRSGLPFTPGFRPGVDVNADGAGNNDPAFLGSAVAGLAEALRDGGCPGGAGNEFAGRNSCREKVQQGLDLHLSIGLPVRAQRVVLQVDAFNVVATETGIVDRAALLIDPGQALITDGAGNVVLPLVANPRLGRLLVRRGEPRVVRVGLRMEY